MRERRNVRISVAMYDDTKFKIIDRRLERDLIHYVWNRMIVLAGKTNQEGDVYMSRTLPYTVETLAIEFNRGTEEVKLALEVLIELEMVEFTEYGVYRVKNFAKHQNIKVKEKIIVKDKEVKQVSEVSINESSIKEVKKISLAKEQKQVEKETVNKNESKNVKKEEISNLDVNKKTRSNVYDNITKEKVNNNSQDSIPIFLDVKNNKTGNKKNKKDEMFEENEDNLIDGIYNGERPLDDGERITMEFAMCN